jgi:hypothetical protein
MKTRTFIALLIWLAAGVDRVSAQYQTIVVSERDGKTISIPAGKVLQVMNFTHESAVTTSHGNLSFGGTSSF